MTSKNLNDERDLESTVVDNLKENIATSVLCGLATGASLISAGVAYYAEDPKMAVFMGAVSAGFGVVGYLSMNQAFNSIDKYFSNKK